MTPARTNILGVGVSAVNMKQALEIVCGWAAQRRAAYVVCRDVHGLVLCQKDRELRRIHNAAGLVTPDGMPLVWLSRRAGHRHVTRVYGPDLLLALAGRAGLRHYFYGGGPGIAEQLARCLEHNYPGTSIAGTYSPPFRALNPEEDEAIVASIRASRSDVVWVGLGTPKQERWMASHVGRVGDSVLIGVGAAFDFHAGTVRQAPLWLQRRGLEWLFRLLIEPRRLWRRYFTVIPLFMLHAVAQASGMRDYSLDDDPEDSRRGEGALPPAG
jgi:N-acetylglucosaminyldiphosphoundecaprenol N-acetyl-beta-D-mannosaminyltransferase